MHTISTAAQIGSAIVARRKTLKLSQSDLGAQLNLSQNRISELEANPETITVAQLLSFASVLGFEFTLDTKTAAKSPKVEW